ncbi:unnamed protein product [Toxocara canis]|uniref:WD_REPEATS_REGION domain-containing protein n=1 Tax=Toxocara canis TaxID=6265 RepID=A0A183TZU4_TOXCA|nr:unnamed protein product [Toxocara canis]
MDVEFDIQPTRVAAHPEAYDRLAVGFIDGSIGFYKFNVAKDRLKVVAARKLKSAVRHIEFSLTGEHLYSVSANKALCVYDVESNKRIRCIRKSHDDLPNVLCILPLSSTKGQQIATGDESGQLRTWDMRVAHPQICSFDDLEGIVNHLEISGNTLLAACSDGTLGAYELRQRKLIVRSEPMSSELLSIAPADSFTYVGNGDGYIEVFKKDQYGNILERIETPHSMGVDCVRLLRGDLLLTASTSNADLRQYETILELISLKQIGLCRAIMQTTVRKRAEGGG